MTLLIMEGEDVKVCGGLSTVLSALTLPVMNGVASAASMIALYFCAP